MKNYQNPIERLSNTRELWLKAKIGPRYDKIDGLLSCGIE